MLFCNYVLKRHPLRRLFLPFFLPFVPAAAARVLDAREMKRVFLSYLWLTPRQRLLEYARDFAKNDAATRVFPQLQEEIERHRRERRVLVLNSASPLFYVQEIAHALGFDHAFGSRVVIHDLQPLVADLTGPNNKRSAKLPGMETAGLLPCDAADSWAYSDSLADLPMLEVVMNAVLVNPNRELAALGQARGWRVIRARQPWRSRAGQASAILRQVLGIY